MSRRWLLALAVLQTPSGKAVYLIEDPGKIRVLAEGPLDLACGPQKPAMHVRIEFTPAAMGTGVNGVVRAIEVL